MSTLGKAYVAVTPIWTWSVKADLLASTCSTVIDLFGAEKSLYQPPYSPSQPKKKFVHRFYVDPVSKIKFVSFFNTWIANKPRWTQREDKPKLKVKKLEWRIHVRIHAIIQILLPEILQTSLMYLSHTYYRSIQLNTGICWARHRIHVYILGNRLLLSKQIRQ